MKKFLCIIIFIFTLVLVGCKDKPNLECPDECYAASKVEDWIPVWCDEFDTDEVDLTKWNVLNTSWGGGNGELQYYHPNNVYIEDGSLVIEAKKEEYGGRQYTSGRLDTKYKGDWLYGRVVVRAKMPSGRGTWAAIWMLPTENKYGTWPRSGEIDIMEYVGYNKDYIHGTIHTEKYNHNKNTQIGKSLQYLNVETDYVDYIMEWEPGKIVLYADDLNLATFTYLPGINQDVPSYQAWPFDQKFHLILNLAIGGSWGGVRGVDENIFPTKMYIDYVRIYQKDYAYKDKAKPEAIKEIKSATGLKNMIYWHVPADDKAIEHYEIYVDQELVGTSRVNSFVLTKLKVDQTYKIEVVAVDFSGKKSKPSEYTLTYR